MVDKNKNLALGVGAILVGMGAVLYMRRGAAASVIPPLEIYTAPAASETTTDPDALFVEPGIAEGISPFTGEPIDPTAQLGTPENPLTPSAPLGPIIPMTQWYVDLDIQNILGWSLEEYLSRWDDYYQARYIAHTLWMDEMTWEQNYAFGFYPTVEQAKRHVGILEIIKDLGGYYTHEIVPGNGTRSIFVLPSDWTGSKSEFFAYVTAIYDGLPAPEPEAVPLDVVPIVSPVDIQESEPVPILAPYTLPTREEIIDAARERSGLTWA